MEEDDKQSHEEGEKEPIQREESPPQNAGGWGWGFSGFSVLSDLQKAAQDISRNVMDFDLI